ncbi:MAG: hypothetical protein ACYTGL_30540, partial [Planctomycetota bacterium]
MFHVPDSLFLVPRWRYMLRCWSLVLVGLLLVHANATGEEPQTKNSEVFRPEAGRFPPLEKAHSYRGELVFVDHANRRGSIRVQGTGVFRAN